MEKYLRAIYILLLTPILILELSYSLFLSGMSKFLELALINIGGLIVAFAITLFLRRILKKRPAVKIFIREELWILIFIFVFTSYGVYDVSRISTANILSLVGPSSLLGGSFLVFKLARIQHWETIGIRNTELTHLLSRVDNALQNKQHEEISWAYKNARYLVLLFITEQMNLLLILISDIFEKLIDETFKILNEPIPKNKRGLTVGYVKRATRLKLNLSLDDSDFDFKEFWTFRARYVHRAIERTAEIVPPEEEIEKSIRLLSKTLREYPDIIGIAPQV